MKTATKKEKVWTGGHRPVTSGLTKRDPVNPAGKRRRHRSEPGTRWASHYPWDQWFALGRFTLVQGKHFDCTMPGMTVNIRVAAKVRGMRVRIDQEPTSLIITVKEEWE